MEVDPLKFRLRAFEHNFVKPIVSDLEREPLLEQRAQITPFWQSLVAGAEEPEPLIDHDAPASIGLMKAFLLAEAGEWIRLGRRIGYFSSEAPLVPITFGGTNLLKDRFVFRYAARPSRIARWYSAGDDDAQHFADELTAATEQLHDHEGRTELVRLLHFATQQEWARLFGMLEELASTLERRPDASFSDAVMEQLSWAFFERRLTSFGAGPSAWRNTLRLISPNGALARERFDQLTEVRKRIAAAAERIGSGDGSTASALLASLLQREPDRRPGGSDLPLMFSRVDEQALPQSNQWLSWNFLSTDE
ncbi:hypothetical protein NG819_21770 (plasmid) [Pseudarthrobacter sp. Fe7]|nr:hypothetical protein NG819_21770 [Pseudarthrobacter sp. Fe7]